MPIPGFGAVLAFARNNRRVRRAVFTLGGMAVGSTLAGGALGAYIAFPKIVENSLALDKGSPLRRGTAQTYAHVLLCCGCTLTARVVACCRLYDRLPELHSAEAERRQEERILEKQRQTAGQKPKS